MKSAPLADDALMHADVLLGQHGAGLAHAVLASPGAIVLEFKTVYGYPLDLFRVAADAVAGTHVHVDLKSSSQKFPGGGTTVNVPVNVNVNGGAPTLLSRP